MFTCVCLFVSADADDISLGSDEKQLIVVLLPDDDNEERALLEQGVCVCVCVCQCNPAKLAIVNSAMNDIGVYLISACFFDNFVILSRQGCV